MAVKLPTWELVAQVAAGKAHSLALTVYGDVYAWGKNWYGETGIGSHEMTAAPTKIIDKGPIFLRLAAGDRHSIGLGLKERPPHLSKKCIERKPLVSLKKINVAYEITLK